MAIKITADFDVDINIKWDYHCLNIPSGILKHVNSGDKHFVHLDGDAFQTFNKVVYENKLECITEFIEKHEGHVFNMCIADPDRSRTHPAEPIFRLI